MRFEWRPGRLETAIEKFDAEFRPTVEAVASYQATRGEAYMKSNAPWTDRTGAARTGLFTATQFTPEELRIIFAHTVHYGIWLEVANSGNYQIIMPSVLHVGNELMGQLNRIMRRMK